MLQRPVSIPRPLVRTNQWTIFFIRCADMVDRAVLDFSNTTYRKFTWIYDWI